MWVDYETRLSISLINAHRYHHRYRNRYGHNLGNAGKPGEGSGNLREVDGVGAGGQRVERVREVRDAPGGAGQSQVRPGTRGDEGKLHQEGEHEGQSRIRGVGGYDRNPGADDG